jgi:hypothetical protein
MRIAEQVAVQEVPLVVALVERELVFALARVQVLSSRRERLAVVSKIQMQP